MAVFTEVPGIQGMSLGCDCYGGCWGDHSQDWSKLVFVSEEDAEEAWRRCHQAAVKGEVLPESERVPRGAYVRMGLELRFSSVGRMQKHAASLRGQ